ncbi:phosphoenolpyruvate carboxylase [Helicobacter turcicus]|uniref:Phosphoenolpyruvate carboxylase n=1 Tax=Helicobacter turcicus TaxID=2867412 RepID=A0ABS7JM54_9HELI|nr:phosphoenolpyruvate carboxylase [Helicobacter turcicus]MBX7490470.1 phosphoenolpyruvate carboxylase [Helicobacter turcicus]MBX7545330.1 phosphoenolpyruvate carboxylase [Helicobacter turcicus]
MDKSQEIEFIFTLICEQLDAVAPQICPLFVALKDGKDTNLDALSAEDISSLIKAFTLYHLLLNIVDERYYLSRIKKGAILETIAELRAQKYDDADIQAVLKKIRFYPVFTAHPTESLRRTFLESYHEMSDDLETWFKLGDKNAKEHLKYRLNLLWNSHIVRSEKIEVLFELDNLLYFMESSILRSGANVLKEVQEALSELGDKEELKKSPIRLGSWIGGDRDGNPYVTNAVMLEVMKRQHETIIHQYLKRIDKLGRELSIAQEFIKPSRALLESLEVEKEHLDTMAKKLFLQEPFRAKLTCMRQKLQNRILALNLPQASLNENKIYMYANSKEFIKDIDMMIESLDKRSSIYLKELKNLALLAGFHLMQLDFRQHRDVFWNALAEIFSHLGYVQGDLLLLPESERTRVLNVALKAPLLDLNTLYGKLSVQTQEMILAFVNFKWAKDRISDNIMDSCIISMCQSANDLLCVLWFAKQSGLWCKGKKTRISISPLFETIGDLELAPRILRELCANPHYAEYLQSHKNYQEIMIGYSDSSKDGGIFASNYSLKQAIKNLILLEDELKIKFRLFHGRGGSVSRGGGALEDALLSSPTNSVAGFLKTTEQGEVISGKYLNPKKAESSFDSALATLLKKSVYDKFGMEIKQGMDFESILQKISAESYKTYRKLVYETEGFIVYFKSATPIYFIQQLNIGSRPSKRKDTQNVEDLRAIPWVFAWTQNRAIIPAWYGLGSGLDAAFRECGDRGVLRRCYQENLFFKTTIDNISQAFLKVDLEIAEHYNAFVEDVNLRKEIWGMIETEYHRTLEWLLYVRNEKYLLESEKLVRESILLRKPFLTRLSFFQLYLMRAYREARYPEQKERIAKQIVTTIVGIAQGIKNTG